jgi:hypothetical protein
MGGYGNEKARKSRAADESICDPRETLYANGEMTQAQK